MTEMTKLMAMLDNAKIPYTVRFPYGEPQVCYPNEMDLICDAICHLGSYGFEAGLLEIMGLVDEEAVGDDVEGWLTAENVFRRIENHYKKQ